MELIIQHVICIKIQFCDVRVSSIRIEFYTLTELSTFLLCDPFLKEKKKEKTSDKIRYNKK